MLKADRSKMNLSAFPTSLIQIKLPNFPTRSWASLPRLFTIRFQLSVLSGIEGGAGGLTAVAGIVPADIHPIGAADTIFFVNTIDSAAVNRKTRTGMLGRVAVTVVLSEITATGLLGRMRPRAVHFNVADATAVIFVVNTAIRAAG